MNDLIVAEKIAQWKKLKSLVLDSVSSPITKRVYNMALDEFMGWFRQEPRPGGFCKATVSAWRASLEVRGLGSSIKVNGGTLMRGPSKSGEGLNFAFVKDPDGNQIELVMTPK